MFFSWWCLHGKTLIQFGVENLGSVKVILSGSERIPSTIRAQTTKNKNESFKTIQSSFDIADNFQKVKECCFQTFSRYSPNAPS
jgi:hypothetical protein